MVNNLTNPQQKIFNILTYYVTGGVLIFNVIITKIFSEPTIWDKVKFGMYLLLIAIVIYVILSINKKLNNKLSNVKDKISKAQSDAIIQENGTNVNQFKMQLKALIIKENEIKSKLNIFHNFCLVMPFIILLILVIKIESGVLELRGTLWLIVSCISGGFIYNIWTQILNAKKLKGGN